MRLKNWIGDGGRKGESRKNCREVRVLMKVEEEARSGLLASSISFSTFFFFCFFLEMAFVELLQVVEDLVKVEITVTDP